MYSHLNASYQLRRSSDHVEYLTLTLGEFDHTVSEQLTSQLIESQVICTLVNGIRHSL